MGLLSFLGIGASDLSEKQVDKIAKLAANPFAQPEVRREQMDKLIRDGSEPAIRGLLNRFTVNASQAIADEEEKRFLVDELAKMGDKVVVPLRSFLRKETNLSLAAQVLLRVMPKEEGIAELIGLLDVYSPEDYRSDEQKRQLALILKDQDDARILPALVPYLLDHSDDVRHQVLELFAERASQGDAAAKGEGVAAAISELVTSADSSPRIARQAAELAADLPDAHKWTLPPEKPLASVIASEFFIDKKGYVRRRVTTSKRT
jgi:hypothetical protein